LATKKKTSTAIDVQPKANIHPRVVFIKSAKLAGIGLDKCVASVDRALLSHASENDEELETDITMSQSVLTHEDAHFVISSDFSLTQCAKGSGKKIVSIAAVFSAKFYLTKPASEELVKGFASLEARLIFFPYLRHFISDISHRMSIDPILLPMTSELEK
jgi:preprotein translocase subunit SecB